MLSSNDLSYYVIWNVMLSVVQIDQFYGWDDEFFSNLVVEILRVYFGQVVVV